MNIRSIQLFWVSFSVACLGIPVASRAVQTNVNINALAFSPVIVTVNPGDQVKWTWVTTFHSTTSTNVPPLWDSMVIVNAGTTYTNTFNTPGGFGYKCTFHGFAGTVLVQGPNTPPLVTITNPADGVTLSAPASLILGASASDPGGTVINVQFLQASTSLGNDPTSPYSINVSGLAAGDYNFSAVASDNGGLKATNAIVVHVINAAPVVLDSGMQLSGTSFRFGYSANTGLMYVVQRSTNLVDWVSLGTYPAGSSSMTFTDSAAPPTPGFYRVGRLPNP